MFSQASNFQIDGQTTFNAAHTMNIYQGTHRDANHDNGLSISDVLKCPAPSQYFVGRADTLRNLSKIFSASVVTVFSPDPGNLANFVRSFSRPAIYIDATSEQTLTNALMESYQDPESIAPNTILVLENAQTSLVLDDHFPVCLHLPILVTSTDSSISNMASSIAHAFDLPASRSTMARCWTEIQGILIPGQRIVSLVASGGTGKTQTISKFIQLNSSRFSNIWFFDATSNATLTSSFKELAKAAGVGNKIKDVQDFLARTHQDWMCIFDSADDEQLFLKDYLPICTHGNIITTSRLVRTSEMDSPNCHIDFRDLNKDDATELLLKHAHEERDMQTQNMASKIVEALGYQALAVSTAGAYIHTNATCTLENYLMRFDKKRKDILNYRLRALHNYQATMLSAFQLSFEKLSPAAQCLMQMCAYLHPAAIPMEIFTRAGKFSGNDTGPGDLNQPIKAISLIERFLAQFSQEDSWDDSVDELCRFSLASYDNATRVLGFHSVMHACARETVNDDANQRCAVTLLLGRAIPLDGTNEDYQFRQQLRLHAQYIQLRNLPTIHVRICLAMIFDDCGFWHESETLYKEVLALRKRAFTAHHPHIINAMASLASTYHALGKLESAEKLGEEVLVLRKKVTGEHHPDTLTSMANLASTYRALEKLESAEKLNHEVLVLRKKVLDVHHPHTLASMNNLASTYYALGKLESAQKLQEEVLVLRKKVNGEHYPDTLTSMANLASTYRALGKLKSAERLGEEVLVLRKKILGIHHPFTLISMANLTSTYLALGKLESVEKLEQELLELRKKITGKHHPHTLTSMANLAWTYHALGKFTSAEKLQEEVLVLLKQVLGQHHPDTLTSMANLATTYYALGKLESAKMLEEEVLEHRKKVNGAHHPQTLTSMASLGWTYHVLGKLKSAEKLEEEVLVLRKKVIGEHHSDTLASMANLASTYHSLGKLERAEKLEEEVLVLRKKILGAQHSDTLTSMVNLAATYYALRKLESAEKLELEVLVLHKKLNGDQHPETLTSMRNLTITYRVLGKQESAEKLEEEMHMLQKNSGEPSLTH